MALKLMYITNKPEVAKIAEANGVDRIWIDLETLGKEERQRGINTVKSHHQISDIPKVNHVLQSAELLVRINPIYKGTANEINSVIESGADIIMLPMWNSLSEVIQFLDCVGRRTKTTLLLETKDAVEHLDQVLEYGGFDEIHIGINDLHLSYNLKFMFELLANGVVDSLCSRIKAAGFPYGFGGIARLGFGLLPSENVILEHYRLGSTRAILSRSFCNLDEIRCLEDISKVFAENMKTIREYENSCLHASIADYQRNHAEVIKIVKEIVDVGAQKYREKSVNEKD